MVAVVVVAVAYRAGAWESRSITEVWITSEREVIVLGHCNRSARVQVEETDSWVMLELQTRGANRGDCLDGVVVRLDRYLGERALIDASTDAPVPIICAEDGGACDSASSS